MPSSMSRRAPGPIFDRIDEGEGGLYHERKALPTGAAAQSPSWMRDPRVSTGRTGREPAPARRGATMYKAVTRGISVTVTPRFVSEESSPEEGRFFFAYTVEIINTGLERVQLRSRHWRIVDGKGQVREVEGPGVVGKQPVLGPGESFSYTSGCPLNTPDGTMQGTYAMVTAAGESFDAEIPAFSLDSPHVKRVVH
jgi:ApaG protein